MNEAPVSSAPPAAIPLPGNIRVVEVVGVYSHITQAGRGVGLLERQLRDASTGEILKRGRGRSALLRHAEKMGWQESAKEPAPLRTPA